MVDIDYISSLFDIRLDSQYSVIRAHFHGVVSSEKESTDLAKAYSDRIYALYEQQPQTIYKTLVDIREVKDTKHHIVSSQAREQYQLLFEHAQTGPVAIVAGASTFSFVTKFIVSLFLHKKHVQFFSDPVVALAWLIKEDV